MPHVVYFDPYHLCPWAGCGYRIEMIDFQLENRKNPALYAGVIAAWGRQPGYGLIGRCPGCGRYVLFSATGKQAVADPAALGLIVLPDDWHQNAFIA
jgi:hypothetical protein